VHCSDFQKHLPEVFLQAYFTKFLNKITEKKLRKRVAFDPITNKFYSSHKPRSASGRIANLRRLFNAWRLIQLRISFIHRTNLVERPEELQI